VTTTKAFAAVIGKQLGREDVEVVPNGFEPADFVAREKTRDESVFRIAYTGVWRKGYGLDDLYSAIALLKTQEHPALHRLKVDAAGFEPGEAIRYGVDNWVTEHGKVSHADAISIMANASLLYMPLPQGFQGRAALAGKHFEYLGSGRPILISATADSETASLVTELGGAIAVEPGDIVGLAQLIATGLSLGGFVEDVLDVPPVDKVALERYSRRSTAFALAQILARAAAIRKVSPAQ
jgi:glycosyltransferase involved in cell wall biosynthesis